MVEHRSYLVGAQSKLASIHLAAGRDDYDAMIAARPLPVAGVTIESWLLRRGPSQLLRYHTNTRPGTPGWIPELQGCGAQRQVRRASPTDRYRMCVSICRRMPSAQMVLHEERLNSRGRVGSAR
jgi:hypothetical protein